MANSSVDGLISGLDTTTIISQLMQLERQPQNRLKTQKTNVSNEIADLPDPQLQVLHAGRQGPGPRPAGWLEGHEGSSSSTAVTATATSSASSGQLSFTVQQLARAGAVASTGTVASTAAIVAGGPVVLSRGADVLGFSNLGAGAGLTTGSHTITVTQATTGAAQTGTTALAGTTTFASDATLDVTVDGVAKTLHDRRRQLHTRPAGNGADHGLGRRPQRLGRQRRRPDRHDHPRRQHGLPWRSPVAPRQRRCFSPPAAPPPRAPTGC